MQTTQTPAEARAEFIAELDTRIDELSQALADKRSGNVLRGEQFVVVCAGLPMVYTFDTRGYVTSAKTGTSNALHLFSRANAEHLAKATRNGNGQQAVAVRDTDFLEAHIAELRATRAMFAK